MRTQLLYLLLLSATYLAEAQPTSPDVVVDFIRANPTRSALYVIRNDTVQIQLRPDQTMPLASAVKTIIAIEFARQAAAGKINPAERIPLTDLDLYYLPNTDGGAHPGWKQWLSQRNLIENETVALLDVAKGMIQFSSNANTEYLLDKLGTDTVNASLKMLHLPNHDPLYPIVSALFLYSVPPANSAKTVDETRRLSAKAYRAKCQAIHNRLKQDKDGLFKQSFIFPDMALQKVWSDRLPGSTVRDYASVMQKINSRTYFPPAVQTILDSIMEWPFAVNPANKGVYTHLGMKGGSTAFVLTNAFYAETLKGNRISAAVFFNNLTPDEFQLLSKEFNNVTIRCIGKAQSAAMATALAK
ncbi:serine hydrolase [Fibrella forsythiae]|uniref:beta-lactamase n=1 Tax=Fibrella forsythiae TaxID=2817061 RepID=A0ABS3JEW5_9BACT|nr:serine hydrolase [Fibrella forsythiae]MBO0948525.1 serine hydrolase [Fibrella forsythiae]